MPIRDETPHVTTGEGGYDDESPLVVQVALLGPTSLKQVVKAIMTRMSTSANTTSRNGVHSLCIG